MHVIVRGIGRQLLFETAEDHTFYLEALKQYSQAVGVTVCVLPDGGPRASPHV